MNPGPCGPAPGAGCPGRLWRHGPGAVSAAGSSAECRGCGNVRQRMCTLPQPCVSQGASPPALRVSIVARKHAL